MSGFEFGLRFSFFLTSPETGYDWLGQKVPTAADAYSPYKRPMPPLLTKALVVTDVIYSLE